MAEAVGVVASGLGVATFAFQIGKTSVELKRLCSDIKDAQENVESLADEIQLFAGLLAEIGHAAVDSESPISTQCLRSCETLNLKLSQLVKDFEQDLRRGKLRGGIRVLRKGKKVKSLKEALERAKSSLSLAFLFNLRNTSTHNNREIRTIVEAGFETLQAGTSTLSPQPQAIELSSNVAENMVLTPQPIANPGDEPSLPRKRHHSHRKRVSFSFTSPTWWLGRVYIFTKYQTYSGWDFSFRTYTAIPDSSPVFEYSRMGDVENLQRLFEKKQASPFVVSEYGSTPLGCAVSCLQLDSARFLLDSGADMNFALEPSFTIAEEAWMNRSFYKESNPDSKKASDVRELLLSHPTLDFVHSFVMRQYLPNHDAGFAEYTALQKGLYFWDEPDDESRSQAVSIWVGAQRVDSFWLALENKTLERSHFDRSIQGFELMRHIAFHVARYHWAGDRCRAQDRQGWHNILKQCVQLNSHLSSLRHQKSLCVGLIRHSLRDWKNSLSDLITNATIMLRAWVSELGKAGADLVEYGHLEHSILFKNNTPYEAMNWTWSETPRIWRVRSRIISFTFGPDISDWSIWFSWPLDEWAGEFWNWIENPILSVPGSWVDDDDDLCIDDREYFEERGYLCTVVGVTYP